MTDLDPLTDLAHVAKSLEELRLDAGTNGNDRELDAHLLEFHRKTAAGRAGVFNLRLGDLDRTRAVVFVSSKMGRTQRLPLDAAFIDELVAFARGRGAVDADDSVFRSKSGAPLSRNRYVTMSARFDAQGDRIHVTDRRCGTTFGDLRR